uniref:Uncharacterized protein n=1 Tax=Magallana gigas TaxID=29159 RepID=K1Q4C7_MAGGI
MADSKSTEVDAIYYDVSPYIIILLRMFNFIVLLMAVGPEKYWYIFLVGTVILFQCITTDIFVYRVLPPPEPTNAPYHPSVRPRNFTINWFSLLEASTKPHFGLDDNNYSAL